jgi:2,3-bisphosphoglycerate-independent phosphoglycerate mutase
MKTVVLLGDGMGDFPVEKLGNRTPLQAAHAPTIRQIAAAGEVRMVSTVPEGLPPGSDVANMAILGYDAALNYTGRAPIEAAGADLAMASDDVAFRCNLVTVQDGTMVDYSAGHISTEEAAELIHVLEQELGEEGLSFHVGVQYRHLLIWKKGAADARCMPPHEISDQAVEPHLPEGPGSEAIHMLMERSKTILAEHPVNQQRVAEGKAPATQIWLWGQGRSMQLDSYQHLYGLGGGIVSAVDLLKGLAKLAGLEAPDVVGATGLIDTNYAGKVAAAKEILEREDFVYVHIEAPDECGHLGDATLKTEAIERFDAHICAPMLEWLEARGEPYQIVLTMDHRTPVALKGHCSDPVPMAHLRGPVGAFDAEASFDEEVNNGVSQGMACAWMQDILNSAAAT